MAVNKSKATPPDATVPADAPPAYAPLPPTEPTAPTASSSQPLLAASHHPHPQGPSPLPLPAPATYRPPNYEQADRRARYRFCGALFWGFLLYIVIGGLVGGTVVREQQRRNDGGHGRHGNRGH